MMWYMRYFGAVIDASVSVHSRGRTRRRLTPRNALQIATDHHLPPKRRLGKPHVSESKYNRGKIGELLQCWAQTALSLMYSTGVPLAYDPVPTTPHLNLAVGTNHYSYPRFAPAVPVTLASQLHKPYRMSFECLPSLECPLKLRKSTSRTIPLAPDTGLFSLIPPGEKVVCAPWWLSSPGGIGGKETGAGR